MTVPKKIAELIQSSGNSFHSKVSRWFSDNGWHVVVSPYYMDQTQSKAREIDLVAEKRWPVTDGFGHPKSYIAVRLFIECKFVGSEAVFGLPRKTANPHSNWFVRAESFGRDNFYTEKHHYLSRGSRVAKLFATDNAKAVAPRAQN